jgi:hypothetical protein
VVKHMLSVWASNTAWMYYPVDSACGNVGIRADGTRFVRQSYFDLYMWCCSALGAC